MRYFSLVCVFSCIMTVSVAAPLGLGTSGSASIQVIDNVIQSVTSQVFSIVGRQLLQGGGLSGGSTNGSRVSVVLPTFPPDDDDDFDDDDDDDDEDNDTRNDSSNETSTNKVFLSNNTTVVTRGTDAKENNDLVNNAVAAEDNAVSKRHVRRIREAEEDQEVAASGGNGPQPADDLSNISVEDADRNKRFLPFGGDAHGGGGSGNFLFDIIRGTADNAARAVGTVYRMVAGTENLGFGVTATSTTTKTQALSQGAPVAGKATAKLVAGSGATEEVDEKEHAAGGVAEIDVAKAGDHYTEGIPGPITRLFVIANRGIANLVQDLILRLAQTSERIVNFKARLITSLI